MASLEHKVPPPVVALLVVAAMWGLAQLLPRVAIASDVRNPIALAVGLAGLAISSAASIQFRRARTTFNPLRPEKASTLVTSGVFRITRNPMYVGMLLGLLAWAIYLGSPLSLAGPVGFIVYINRFQIGAEERAMAQRFGAEFEAYRGRVRRWL